jgi:hypothetical protein
MLNIGSHVNTTSEWRWTSSESASAAQSRRPGPTQRRLLSALGVEAPHRLGEPVRLRRRKEWSFFIAAADKQSLGTCATVGGFRHTCASRFSRCSRWAPISAGIWSSVRRGSMCSTSPTFRRAFRYHHRNRRRRTGDHPGDDSPSTSTWLTAVVLESCRNRKSYRRFYFYCSAAM